MPLPNLYALKASAFVVITLVLSSISGLLGQGDEPFKQILLSVAGKVRNVLVEDLNVDGRKDLLVIHSDYQFESDRYTRLLSIFLQSPEGFPFAPNQTIEAYPGDVLLDLAAPILSGKTARLMFLRTDGVYARSFKDGLLAENSERVLVVSSIFWDADPQTLYYWDFCRELNNQKGDELLIPKPRRLDVYAHSDSGDYRLESSYAVHMDLRLNYSALGITDDRFITTTTFVDRLVFDDFDGDGFHDLAVTWEDRIDVYLFRSNSDNKSRMYELIHPDKHLCMGVMTRSDRESQSMLPMQLRTEVEDLNGDGLADVLVSKSANGAFLGGISQVQIFLNRGGWFDAVPDRIFTSENFSGEYTTHDFNGDGRKDIALLTSKLGIFSLFKLFVARKINSEYSFFVMDEDGTYPEPVAEKVKFSHSVDIGKVLLSSPAQSFDGDYNGDGLLDLLVVTGNDEISIFFGQADRLFNKKADWKFTIKTSSLLKSIDLNGDQKSDLVFWYRGDKVLEGKVSVLLSR